MDKLQSFTALCVALFIFPFLPSAANAQAAAQDSLQRLLENHPGQDDRRADLLNQLSYQLQFSDPEQGLRLAQEVIDFADRLKDNQLLYRAYGEKANNLLQLARYYDALKSAQKALEGFETTGSKIDIAFCHSTIGIIYNHLNNYPKALESLQQSAKLLREEGHSQESTMYLNMARIYGERKQYDKAQEYLTQANAKAVEHGNQLLQTYCAFNMATLKLETGAPTEGRKLLDSALVLAISVNDRMMVGRIYGSIGNCFNDLKQHDSAEHYLQLAIDFNERIGNERSRALALMALSDTYRETGETALAFRYAAAAYAVGKSLGMVDLQQSAAKSLSEHHEKNRRMDSALFYFKQQTALLDSIDNENNKAELTRLELQYDFDLKEQEYLQQQAISKLRFRQLWLSGLLVIVGLLAAAGVLFYRNRLRTAKLTNEMREKELTRQAEALLYQQQLSESELKVIRSQMNPHFIFNVLNSIESYILENDARTASKLVQRFAKLSRLVLENSTQTLVAADREWSALELYLELESERFDHDFDYCLDAAPDLALSEILVPPMLIQPLVENAIHHGLRSVAGHRGEVRVVLAKQKNQLVITVTDNGIGLAAAKSVRIAPSYKEKSLGIESIKERLALLAASYPNASSAEFAIHEIKDGDSTCTQARLILPYLPVVSSAIQA